MSGMGKTTIRVVFALLAIAYVMTHFIPHGHAQSSLGIGTNEAIVPTGGFFAGFLAWVNAQQQDFYRALTGALKAMRDDGSKLWLLVGLSFAYGVFHAAGPGHGKAVISSYMLANEVALRRGIMLSFVSAFLQGAVAIALITLVFLALRGTSISMTDATWFLEVVSYALIACFGAWLLWQKVRHFFIRPALSLSSAAAPAGHSHHNHAHASTRLLRRRDSAAHDPVYRFNGDVCETCGHSHAPDPAMLSGDRFTWNSAWSAVAAVGIRPCSGALIVLTFAFLNGLWAGGVLSVFAMSLGTAITVSILATLAVTAKNWAVALAGGNGRLGNTIHASIEMGGAALVLLLGLTLLSASLAA
jgi:nickel/cobalt exporter